MGGVWSTNRPPATYGSSVTLRAGGGTVVYVVGLVLLAAVAAGSWVSSPVEWKDSDSDVHRGAVIGYVLFLAVAASPQGYRLELTGLPTLAVALAWGADIAARPGWRSSSARRSIPSEAAV
jgi:hypothetical protein